jgi:C-terminal processing protease CtpA/Prc
MTRRKDGAFDVVAVNPNSPAERAGIHAANVLVAVNGCRYATMDIAQIRETRNGNSVTLLVRSRDRERSVTLPLTDRLPPV